MSIAQLVESDTACHVFLHSDAETIEIPKEFTVVEAARRELLEEMGLDIPVEEFRQAWQRINHTEFKQDHIGFVRGPSAILTNAQAGWLRSCVARVSKSEGCSGYACLSSGSRISVATAGR